jgi:Flp pilus assembly protein TadG
MKRNFARRSDRDSGAAAVELAIILPILLLIIAGIVDFGRAYFTQVTLTNAAREGARAAVMMVSAADVQARTLAAIPEPLKSTSVVTPDSCAAAGDDVTVSVRTNFDWIILEPMMNLVGGSNLPQDLSSSATMRCGG